MITRDYKKELAVSRDGISVKPIYQHFLKYRLSVKVRTDKISAIGYKFWLNIGYISAIFPGIDKTMDQ